MLAGQRVDLPSNGSVKKLTGASFLAEMPAHLNMSKRTSLTKSCRYLNPGALYSELHTHQKNPPIWFAS
ncbi:hypothetical protein Hanom_Chr16g01480281 [Helianthus anomalus]